MTQPSHTPMRSGLKWLESSHQDCSGSAHLGFRLMSAGLVVILTQALFIAFNIVIWGPSVSLAAHPSPEPCS